MKHVVSVSIGSSKRNHKVDVELLGEKVIIERIGTDGDMDKAIELLKELDGKVDAFGLGGTDLYLFAGQKKYLIRDAAKIAKAVNATPLVDGSGLKNTLERRVIQFLDEEGIINFREKKVLMVSAMDRFGMAEALEMREAKIVYGDLIFALGIPVAIKNLKTLHKVANIIAPVAVQLPFKMLYPVGEKQEKTNPKYEKYYAEAEIIAGDFLFIKRYMPENLKQKIIITNTVTKEDVALLKDRGVKLLITTTPELEGRSFGTNVMEALLVAFSSKKENLTVADYDDLLNRLNLKPRVTILHDDLNSTNEDAARALI